jgi:hypothetical protein
LTFVFSLPGSANHSHLTKNHTLPNTKNPRFGTWHMDVPTIPAPSAGIEATQKATPFCVA